MNVFILQTTNMEQSKACVLFLDEYAQYFLAITVLKITVAIVTAMTQIVTARICKQCVGSHPVDTV